MKPRISISATMVRLSFAKFAEWHKRTLPHDTETAEFRYKELGGKVPTKEPKKAK